MHTKVHTNFKKEVIFTKNKNRMDPDEIEFMSDEELATMELMLQDIEEHPDLYPEIELMRF